MSVVFEVGSDHDWMSNENFLRQTENDMFSEMESDRIRLLRSGRDALRYAARACKDRIHTVLLPALSCSCMPDVFEKEGYRIIYYRLQPDYSVDVQDVLSRLISNCFFLCMNYFGMPSIRLDEICQIVNAKDNVLTIEDVTHEFMSRKPDSFHADFTVCSMRKWLAIADGGFLAGKEPLADVEVVDDEYFAPLRKTAMLEKSKYLQSGLPEIKERFRARFKESTEYIDAALTIGNMDKESISVLSHFDADRAYNLRRQNTDLLYTALKEMDGIQFPGQDRDFIKSTLYFPVLVEEQKKLQQALAENGVYAPVIWPLAPYAEGVCPVAGYTSKHMLAIPCDHRYSKEDMLRVIDIIKNAMESDLQNRIPDTDC